MARTRLRRDTEGPLFAVDGGAAEGGAADRPRSRVVVRMLRVRLVEGVWWTGLAGVGAGFRADQGDPMTDGKQPEHIRKACRFTRHETPCKVCLKDLTVQLVSKRKKVICKKNEVALFQNRMCFFNRQEKYNQKIVGQKQ